MSHTVERLRRSIPFGYLVAFITVGAAYLLSLAFLRLDSPLPFTGFALTAILITFWYGSTGPGIFAVFLSTVVRSCYFQPAGTVLTRALYDSVFLGFALVMIWLTRERTELEVKVAERTAELTGANEKLKIEIVERKRAEEEVRRAEDRLQHVLDTTPALIHTGRADGYLDYFNQCWLKYVGCTLDDLMGWAWTAVIHPDDVQGTVDKWRASLSSGEPFEHEARVRRADGVYRWMLHRKVPQRDENGSIVRWYGSSSDIEDLKRTEDRVRLIIDTIPVMTWSVRPDGVVDFLNHRWIDYSGTALDQYVKEPTHPIHPEDLPGVMDKWLADMAAGDPYEDEMRLRRADGEYRWFLVRTAPLRDEHGKIVKWYGVSIDIEDRKRAEEALRSSELEQRHITAQLERERARLVEAQEVAKVGSWETELQSLNVVWSEQTHRIFETDPSQFHPTRPKFVEFIYPEDRAKVDAAFAASLDKRSPSTVEYRIVMPDGRIKILEERWQAFHDEEGKPVRLAGTCRDITEPVIAREELRQARERMESILNGVSDTFILFDRQWRYLYLNDAAVRATGLPLNEILGRTIWELFPVVVGTELDRQFHRAMEERGSIEFEFHFLQPGTDQWWVIRTYPAPEGLAVFATDITEHKRVDEQLRRLSGEILRSQDEERRRIARDLHDATGQNLVALATMLGQLSNSIPSAEQKSRALLSECKALAEQCIREVRTLSYVLHPPVLDQAGLEDAIREYVAGFTERSGILVNLEVSPRFGRLNRDVELSLFRVVQESLTNIQRHSGSLQATIRVVRDMDEVTLEISDLGRGISNIPLKGGEEPAFEVGVGIPSMRERVRLAGGRIDIESTSHGTIVRVTLPFGERKSEKTAHSGG